MSIGIVNAMVRTRRMRFFLVSTPQLDVECLTTIMHLLKKSSVKLLFNDGYSNSHVDYRAFDSVFETASRQLEM